MRFLTIFTYNQAEDSNNKTRSPYIKITIKSKIHNILILQKIKMTPFYGVQCIYFVEINKIY